VRLGRRRVFMVKGKSRVRRRVLRVRGKANLKKDFVK